MRKKDLPHAEEKMQLMRVWKLGKAKKVPVAEEEIL